MLVRASKPTVHATKRVANVNSKKNITRSIIARKPLREAVIVNHHGPMVNLLFTPDAALAGGVLIGAMTVAKRLNSGKNLGVSGETKALMRGISAPATTLSFLLGLLAAGYAAPMVLGAQAAVPMVEGTRAIVAGALVGAGSSIGCGCTSGHGVSGIGRLSTRSIVATCVFMACGAATVAAFGTVGELHVSEATRTLNMLARAPEAKMILYGKIVAAGVAIQAALYALAKREGGGITDVVKKLELASEGFIGFFFGLGLVVSGMTNPAKVAGFLAFTSKAFDPSLAFVMGGALTVVIASTYAAKKVFGILRPSMAREFTTQAKYIDKELIIGSAMFGAGWGLAGICPGPGLVNLVMNAGREITLWCLAFFIAQAAHQRIAAECKFEE